MFNPSYELCSEHFYYDAYTGFITWKKPTSHRIVKGQEAGSKRKDGYRRVSFKGGIIASHRLAWLLHYGDWPQGDIDHINRCRDDNRIVNLRVATSSENARNRDYRKPGDRRHGGCGVKKNKRTGKWQVQVHCWRTGKPIYGGVFKEKDEALAVAAEMRRRIDE